MNKRTLLIPLFLIVLFAVAAVPTRAQATYGVRANVPFDFVVGDKTIPAGRISAHGVSEAFRGALAISNLNDGKIAVRAGRRLIGTERTNECKLVFHKYGNRYFLAQIWLPGYQAWEVMKSKEERSLQRDQRLVKNFKPESVVVAAALD